MGIALVQSTRNSSLVSKVPLKTQQQMQGSLSDEFMWGL
jgi:hypothetical protein